MLLQVALGTILVGYDLAVTQRRLPKYGIDSELNALTRYLCKHMGIINGTLAGIMVPHMLFSLLAVQNGWSGAYWFYLGWLLKQFGMTLASLPVEHQIDEIRARTKAEPPQPGA